MKGSAGSVCEGRLRGTGSWWGLRGTSPALAGNVGTGGAFARPRDGDQDVDVPTLAPARSRCRFVEAHGGAGDVRRRSAPTGHCIPARCETPGTAHNRSVLKEGRIPPDSLACFAAAECRDWRWGSVPRRSLEDIGRWGLRGTSPALAGNVGTGRAFARPRDGDQDVDVPTLAPARSRCRWSRGRSHLFTQKGTLFTRLMSLLGLRGICSAAASWRPKG